MGNGGLRGPTARGKWRTFQPATERYTLFKPPTLPEISVYSRILTKGQVLSTGSARMGEPSRNIQDSERTHVRAALHLSD